LGRSRSRSCQNKFADTSRSVAPGAGGNQSAPPQNVGVKSQPGPPMTLGGAAAARVRLIVWCKECQHQVEPDLAESYGPEMPVPE
jgi:hypothetical protein